jgi:hypothetical protein
MTYEVRIAGQAPEQFDRVEDAEARARAAIRANADARVEVIDLSTGQPYAPAAGAEDREDLAGKIGF